ncbi:MAG: hypothetical protein ACWGPN_14125, partial [Gammaproteobacteria bacterium]
MRSAPVTAIALVLAMVAGSSALAQTDRAFLGEFDARAAVAAIYGGETWADASLAQYQSFADTDRAFVAPLFDAAFVEQGSDKHVVIATLTPKPIAEYACHACAPLLGGAVFVRDADGWHIEAEGTLIEPGNAWGTELTLVQIGWDRYGVLHRISDLGGGIEYKQASLIFAEDGVLATRFSVPGRSSPGPGACQVPESYQHISFAGGFAESTRRNEPLFDIVVDAQWNDGVCRTLESDGGLEIIYSGRVCHRIDRYRRLDGEYRLLTTHLDA